MNRASLAGVFRSEANQSIPGANENLIEGIRAGALFDQEQFAAALNVE